MDQALFPVLRLLYLTAGAFVVAALFGAVVAFIVGGADRRKRRAVFRLVAPLCLLLYAIVVVPKLLGAH